ncbi:formin homology 2 domain containing protein, putative [Babesia bigemina]|uniref:Formin homology 2 domain containing protein, putative n=1 Tax=Babesia bigemina TaxID=5866 RepID=A0A061DEN6_BABBI|nr:formin homology 2 domain containing protein, putative [Babesia bigemina]CDR97595.1 formin homology 2 domain containing protein, putative [Babesia bigemina]|eukprot:XP_012769781.1 formin homology 2 domain containing protein, putative [Babesia bigemina]
MVDRDLGAPKAPAPGAENISFTDAVSSSRMVSSLLMNQDRNIQVARSFTRWEQGRESGASNDNNVNIFDSMVVETDRGYAAQSSPGSATNNTCLTYGNVMRRGSHANTSEIAEAGTSRYSLSTLGSSRGKQRGNSTPSDADSSMSSDIEINANMMSRKTALGALMRDRGKSVQRAKKMSANALDTYKAPSRLTSPRQPKTSTQPNTVPVAGGDAAAADNTTHRPPKLTHGKSPANLNETKGSTSPGKHEEKESSPTPGDTSSTNREDLFSKIKRAVTRDLSDDVRPPLIHSFANKILGMRTPWQLPMKERSLRNNVQQLISFFRVLERYVEDQVYRYGPSLHPRLDKVYNDVYAKIDQMFKKITDKGISQVDEPRRIAVVGNEVYDIGDHHPRGSPIYYQKFVIFDLSQDSSNFSNEHGDVFNRQVLSFPMNSRGLPSMSYLCSVTSAVLFWLDFYNRDNLVIFNYAALNYNMLLTFACSILASQPVATANEINQMITNSFDWRKKCRKVASGAAKATSDQMHQSELPQMIPIARWPPSYKRYMSYFLSLYATPVDFVVAQQFKLRHITLINCLLPGTDVTLEVYKVGPDAVEAANFQKRGNLECSKECARYSAVFYPKCACGGKERDGAMLIACSADYTVVSKSTKSKSGKHGYVGEVRFDFSLDAEGNRRNAVISGDVAIALIAVSMKQRKVIATYSFNTGFVSSDMIEVPKAELDIWDTSCAIQPQGQMTIAMESRPLYSGDSRNKSIPPAVITPPTSDVGVFMRHHVAKVSSDDAKALVNATGLSYDTCAFALKLCPRYIDAMAILSALFVPKKLKVEMENNLYRSPRSPTIEIPIVASLDSPRVDSARIYSPTGGLSRGYSVILTPGTSIGGMAPISRIGSFASGAGIGIDGGIAGYDVDPRIGLISTHAGAANRMGLVSHDSGLRPDTEGRDYFTDGNLGDSVDIGTPTGRRSRIARAACRSDPEALYDGGAEVGGIRSSHGRRSRVAGHTSQIADDLVSDSDGEAVEVGTVSGFSTRISGRRTHIDNEAIGDTEAVEVGTPSGFRSRISGRGTQIDNEAIGDGDDEVGDLGTPSGRTSRVTRPAYRIDNEALYERATEVGGVATSRSRSRIARGTVEIEGEATGDNGDEIVYIATPSGHRYRVPRSVQQISNEATDGMGSELGSTATLARGAALAGGVVADAATAMQDGVHATQLGTGSLKQDVGTRLRIATDVGKLGVETQAGIDNDGRIGGAYTLSNDSTVKIQRLANLKDVEGAESLTVDQVERILVESDGNMQLLLVDGTTRPVPNNSVSSLLQMFGPPQSHPYDHGKLVSQDGVPGGAEMLKRGGGIPSGAYPAKLASKAIPQGVPKASPPPPSADKAKSPPDELEPQAAATSPDAPVVKKLAPPKAKTVPSKLPPPSSKPKGAPAKSAAPPMKKGPPCKMKAAPPPPILKGKAAVAKKPPPLGVRLHWKPLNINAVKGTIFENLPKPSAEDKLFDSTLVKQLFSKATIKRQLTMKAPELKRQLLKEILDPKRAQNIGIILRFNNESQFDELIDALDNLKLDDPIVNIDNIFKIQSALPQGPEVSAFTAVLQSKADLSEFRDVEQKVFKIVKRDFMDDKVKVAHFALNYKTLLESINNQLGAFQRANEQIAGNEFLPIIMGGILQYGNFVNHGDDTVVQTPGFSLSSAIKLIDLKSADNSLSSMHYLVVNLVVKFPDLDFATFDKSLHHVFEAEKISANGVDELFDEIRDGLNFLLRLVERVPQDTVLYRKTKALIAESTEATGIASERHETVFEATRTTWRFLGEECKQGTSLDEIFRILADFMRCIKRVMNDIQQRPSKFIVAINDEEKRELYNSKFSLYFRACCGGNMEEDEGVDSDLELGIALSISQQASSESERPVLKTRRRRLLPPVAVCPRSKKLLRNVCLNDRAAARRIHGIIDAAFKTLHAVGDAEGDPSDPLDVDALELALLRLGFAVDEAQLQDMLRCYQHDGTAPASSQLAEFALYTRETVGNRNVESEWRPKGAGSRLPIERIDQGTFRDIFLDCNLRMENNGLIY